MSWAPKFLKNRRLQVDILTVFLLLVATSCLFIITYTYSKNYNSILNTSRTMVERAGSVIFERLRCITYDTQELPPAASALVSSPSDVSIENVKMTNYMLNLMSSHPNLAAFYIGTDNGSLLEVINLIVSEQTNYQSYPKQPLPKEAIYALRYVDRTSTKPTEVYYYKDKDFKTISEEKIVTPTFDSRKRPWYQKASEIKEIYWTDVYLFDPTNKPGITVAYPILDVNQHIIGVVAADISFTLLSQFLSSQVVGISGKALLLDAKNGNIIIPKVEKTGLINIEAIQTAYQQYLQTQKNDFVFDQESEQYLATFRHFPIAQNNEWLIVMIAPINDFFGEIIRTQKQVVFISIAIFVISILLVILFAKRISRPISILAKEIDKITHLELDSTLRVESNIKEISVMDSSIASMRSAIKSFARYVPKEIVKQLVQKGQEITLGGEKKEISVFFTDIVGFTPIAESLPVETLMPLLAEYFDRLSKIIISEKGTIDKYIGDSIMAFWGAPNSLADHCRRACLTALFCQKELISLNAERKSKNLPQFFTRIGIDTGTVIVGNIGTKERINYTVIGDTVNSAARLQTVNNIYHTQVIISEHAYQQIKEEFLIRPLDIVMLKGKTTKSKIFELIACVKGPASLAPTQEQEKLCREFTKAYELYSQNEHAKAKELFLAIHNVYPDDVPTSLYLERLKTPTST